MAVAILAAVVVLLVIGLVVALWAAARARRKFPLAFKPAPWSADELDGLSSDLTDLGGPDPIAALARGDSATHGGWSEPKPVTYAAGRAEVVPTAALEPVDDASGDVPVVLLVASAGFLGTGTTAALREGGRPRTRADLQRPREARERRLRLA
jgi:hypothetical protein